MLTLILSTLLLGIFFRYTIVYLIKFIRWKRRADALTAGLPSWPTVPLLGSALKLAGNINALKLFDEIVDISEKKEGRFKLWMGPKLIILTTVPEDIVTINNTFLDKPFFYKFAALWTKNGIASAPSELWKITYKRVHKVFSLPVVDATQEVYNEYAKKILRYAKKEAGKPAFDIFKYLSFIILEATCHTIMGVRNVDNKVITDEYYNSFNQASSLLFARSRNILHYPHFLYRLTSNYRQFKKCVGVIHRLSSMLIKTKTEELEQRLKNGYTTLRDGDDDEKPQFKSLLDSLVELRLTDPTLTLQQIQADVDNIIAAGYDTTAVSTLVAIMFIGSHPEVQEKLYNEMREIFQDSDRDVTKRDLERMHYCEAVVNESQRMHPIVPIIMRHADKELKLDGYTIPKGAECAVYPWGACRSRLNWGEDAREFRPERWFEETNRHPAAYAAFSYGRRNCIGKRGGIAFMKTILAYCIREVEFKSQYDKFILDQHVTLYPVAGPGRHVEVRMRDSWTERDKKVRPPAVHVPSP